ncbi:hypothetical protein [Nitratireductor luteus]|uniref:hypothetical protein n=1 Tax=Nitratireductor luteus TaxID=2976980 RepID=UPI00223F9E53|nr:hypothetical protein [Nitratireductor luteus]
MGKNIDKPVARSRRTARKRPVAGDHAIEPSADLATAGTPAHEPGPSIARRISRTDGKAKPKGTGMAGNLLLLSFSVALAVGIAEVFLAAVPQLQVQAGEGEYVFCAPPHSRHLEHPEFGYIETPGASYFERNSSRDPWYYVKVNDEGFRDNHNHGGEQVIVLGDSFARGTLVNEYETFSSLMNQWYPDTGFRIYSAGGYGQANTLRIYQDKGTRIPHRLVIQQFTLPNDIDDNVERTRMAGDGVEIDFAKITAKTTQGTVFLLGVHASLWRTSNLYRLIYSSVIRSRVENWDARRNIDNALELTRRLLVGLAEEARANDADLLVLVIPGWPEIVGRDDGMASESQREMLRGFVSQTPNASVLDVTPRLASEDPDRTYGVIDKHLTPYGHFVVADVLDQWLWQTWRGGSEGTRPEREFVEYPPVTADCTLADDYLDWVKSL